jgi:hypothetical protein
VYQGGGGNKSFSLGGGGLGHAQIENIEIGHLFVRIILYNRIVT